MKLIHIPERKHSIRNSIIKAKAILKYKPDIIFLEYPRDSYPKNKFNSCKSRKQQLDILNKWKKRLLSGSKKYPWLKGDILIFENIEKLLENKKIRIFQIDAPLEVTRLCDPIVNSQNRFLFDIWNFVREIYMARDIARFLKKNLSGLLFCHDSHWKNIKFLLREKNKENILRFYFKTKSIKEIKQELCKYGKIGRVLIRYFCSIDARLNLLSGKRKR